VGRRWVFTVPGRPIPKARHRHGQGRAYDPPKNQAYAEQVRWAALSAGLKPVKAAEVNLHIYCEDRRYGDIDNYRKAVTDALHGIAWKNDRVIWGGTTTRHLADPATARVEVEIREVNEEDYYVL